MKGIFLVKNGDAESAFEIQECSKPKLKSGQVLVRVKCFGLNYAEVMARRGLYRDSPELPFIPGYDLSGIVEEVGENVDLNLLQKKVMALSNFGSYAEYVVCEANLVCEMPEAMSFEEGTAVGVQYNTAYFMMSSLGQIAKEDKVLVRAAAGGVGTALLQLLKTKNCEVVAVVGHDQKVKKLLETGLSKVYNYRSPSSMSSFEKEDKFDIIFNPVGGKVYKSDMKNLAFGGKMVLYGASSRSGVKGALADVRFLIQMGVQIPIFLLAKSQSIIGINMLKIASKKPSLIQQNMQELASLYQEGKIHPKIDKTYSAENISEAHDYLESGLSSGKIVLSWN